MPLQRDEVLKVRAQLEDVIADRNRLKVYCPNTFGAELAALARHDFPADKVRRPHCTFTAPTSSCRQAHSLGCSQRSCMHVCSKVARCVAGCYLL